MAVVVGTIQMTACCQATNKNCQTLHYKLLQKSNVLYRSALKDLNECKKQYTAKIITVSLLPSYTQDLKFEAYAPIGLYEMKVPQ